MSSNSSTSSSKRTGQARLLVALGPLEKMARARAPWAAIALVVVIALIETTLHHHHIWFADRAAWQWEVKREMLASKQLTGDIAILGTSVLFHAADPPAIHTLTQRDTTVANLALNGMQMQHITQMVEREHQQGTTYPHLLLELRDVDLSRESWFGGPYWRLWASPGDVLTPALLAHEPGMALSFASNRLLTSFNYRVGLDNWLFASARARRPAVVYRDRNEAVTREMITRLGYSESGEKQPLTSAHLAPPKDRPWSPNPPGLYWLDRLAAHCAAHEVRLTLLSPPAPPHVAADRKRSGYDDGLRALVSDLQRRHPQAQIQLLTFESYELADFTDEVHYSPAGVAKINRDIARWVDALQP